MRVRRKSSRDTLSAVSSTVPSASTVRMERSTRSLLAWVPHFMPEALLATMPPTMADFFDAGSGSEHSSVRLEYLADTGTDYAGLQCYGSGLVVEDSITFPTFRPQRSTEIRNSLSRKGSCRRRGT